MPGRTARDNSSLHCPDKVNAGSECRGPLLLIMGGQDHLAPAAITSSTLRQCRHSSAVTDLEEIDRGDCLAIDSGWREMAGACLAWLGRQGL